MIKQNTQLNLIQVLRGIASLLVVLFHVTITFATINKQAFGFNFFLFGGAGVDIFFVLSGFIITYTSFKTLNRPDKVLPFISRRFVRIFPAYWIIIGLFLLTQIIFPTFYKTHYDFSVENLLSTVFLLPGHVMVNGVSWTLSFELFFYLLFSIAFIIPKRKWAFCLFAFYAMILIALPVLQYNFDNSNEWVKLITSPMNIEFFMGVIAAAIIRKIPRNLSLPLVITGSIIFLTSGVCADLNYYLLHNIFNRVLLFGIPAFLIVIGLVRFELNNQLKVHNILLSLGEASYSLYLIHLPLISAAIKLIGRLNIQNNIILHLLLFIVIILVCCTSVLFYKCIEKPLIDKLNKRIALRL